MATGQRHCENLEELLARLQKFELSTKMIFPPPGRPPESRQEGMDLRLDNFLLAFQIVGSLLLALNAWSAQSVTEMPSFEREVCVAQFSNCFKKTNAVATAQDTLRALCENRRAQLQCERLKQTSSQKEKDQFFSCDDPGDLCDQTHLQKESYLYSCGAGVGGVLLDATLGFLYLPKSVWELSQNLSNLPENYKSCSSDFQAKRALLGELRPKDMTDDAIQRMSCGEIQKFIDSKVSTILQRLETRRLQLATSSGNESVRVSDLKLTDQELQALNYDLDHSGPLRRALCMRKQAAVQTLCEKMTTTSLTFAGATGTARLVKTFTEGKILGASSKAAKAETLEQNIAAAKKEVPDRSSLSQSGPKSEFERAPPSSSNSARRTGGRKTVETLADRKKKAAFHIENTKKSLDQMGVTYQKMPETYINEAGQERSYWTHHAHVSDAASPAEGGELYQVLSAGHPKTTSPVGPALEHSDMAELLKDIQANGYKLVVDSTLDFPESATPGLHAYEEKILAISPKTTWSELQHEYQHLLFAKHVRQQFPSLQMQVQTGKDLNSLLSDSAKSHFSQEQLEQMEKLMKVGVHRLAVDERMASMRQLQSLGWRRVTVDGIRAEAYGLKFTQNYLQTLSQTQRLTALQKKTLVEVSTRIEALAEREQSMAATSKSVSKLSAAAVFGPAVFLNQNGEIVFQDPHSQKWVLLKGK